jgi:hypothetical protein
MHKHGKEDQEKADGASHNDERYEYRLYELNSE